MTRTLTLSTRVPRIRALAGSSRFRWTLAAVMLAMLAVARAAFPSERDQYWSARAGLENLAGEPLARADSWSWSAEGVWYPNSPAWNLALGLAWDSLGYWGLFWVALASIGLLLGLSLFAARAAGARPLPALLAFVPILLASSAALSARATVVVQAALLGSALFAWWWGGRLDRRRPILDVGIVGAVGFTVSLVGNWVHLSFMLLAGAVALMWAITWWLSPGIGNGVRIALTASGTAGLFLGCVLSPYGIGLTLERSRIVGEICRGLIVEWTSVPAAIAMGEVRWIPVVVVALLAAGGCAVWVGKLVLARGRFDARVRLVLPLAVLGVPITLAGTGAIRFLAVGMLVLLPVAAAALTSVVDRVHRQQRDRRRWSHPKLVEYSSGRFWVVVLTGIAIVMLPLTAVVATKGARPAEADLAAVLPEDCSLFSDAATAGPILLARPDVKVWLDGRADFYGRAHLIEANRIFSAAAPIPHEVDCVVLPLTTGSGRAFPIVAELDGDGAWERVTTHAGYGMWVRDRD